MRPEKTLERLARERLIDSLEVGDLIRLNDKLRVVRGVSKYRGSQRTRCVTFAIRRCSWTRRPDTVRNRFDLYRVRLAIVKKGFGLGTDALSVLLQSDIDNNTKTLECCDVVGVID